MLTLVRRWAGPTGLLLGLRLILSLGSFCSPLAATEGARKPFAVPAAAAEMALETFSEQADVQLVYLIDDVRGVATNPVQGDFAIHEALKRLVAGTGLRAEQDGTTGAFVIKRTAPLGPPATAVGGVGHSKKNVAKSSNVMKRNSPIAVLATWMAFVVGNAQANETATGAIEGRVFNTGTGTAVANARVGVENSSKRTTTDNGGRFLLTNIAPGSVRLLVDFVGLEPKTLTVEVPAGGLVRTEVELSRGGTRVSRRTDEVVRLEKFTVVEDSEMSAQAVAVNEQRNAASIKNVVALGEYGDRGSENIGEFLLFLPGVSVNYSGAEADSISVRGMPSNSTGIMLDGAQIGNGNGNTRTVSLRALPVANVSRVEITKVPTPDTPASGLGGTINLISASGFDRRKAEFDYQVSSQFHNTTGLTFDGGRRWQLPETTARFNEPSVDLRYTRPVGRDFAFTISASRTWRINPDQGDEQATWDLVRNFQTSSAWARLTQIFETRSGQLGADWRLGSKGILSASVMRRGYQRPTTRSNFSASFGAGATGGATFTQGAASGVGSISQGLSWRVDDFDTTHATVRYRYQGAVWKLDASGAWSESSGRQSEVSRGFFLDSNASVTNLIIRGDDIPASGGIIPRRFSARDRLGNSIDIYNGANYSLNSGTSAEFLQKGAINHGRLDLTRAFEGKVPLVVKLGSSINKEKRNNRSYPKTWNFRPNGATDPESRLAGKYDVFDEAFLKDPPKMWGVPFRTISHRKFYELFQNHPDWFVLDEPLAHQNRVNNSRSYSETISAGYLRADLRLFENRLWIATGVRYEKTAGEGQGPLDDINAQYQRDATGNFIRNAAGQRVLVTSDPLALRKLRFKERGAKASTDYGDYYPSLNATYNLTEKLVIRAAFAKTVGRPNINFITPGVTISDPDVASPRITVNNPNLKPWTARNFDFSVESYNFKDGVGSIGIFQKNIRDFFGTLDTPVTPALLAAYNLENDPLYSNYSLSTQTNVDNAKVSGTEVGYRQTLSFLPHWARGVQIFFNSTKLRVTGSRTADFSSFNPSTYSAGINLIRERYYIKATYSMLGQVRTSAVAPSATVPNDTYNYQAKLTRIGASAQYNFSRRIALFFGMSDINAVNKVLMRFSPETPAYARGTRYQSLGYYTTIGLKGTF